MLDKVASLGPGVAGPKVERRAGNLKYGMIFSILDFFLRRRWAVQVKLFEEIVGYSPRIALPKQYHEKMLWRKIFDHNPQFTIFSDKLAAKDFMRGRAPELDIPETLWAGDSLTEAPRNLINDEAVIKTNHGSTFNYFPARENLNWEEVYALFASWMREPYGKHLFEWGYFNVAPRVLIEKLVPVAPGSLLLDISIECTDGVAAYGYITVHHKTEHKKLSNFAVSGEKIALFGRYMDENLQLPPGLNLEPNFRMAVRFAEKLSQDIDYARFDFLGNGKDLYGGEITVYPAGGVFKATPDGLTGGDMLVNAKWDIRKSWFLRTPQRGWKKYYARVLNKVLREDRSGPTDH